MAKTSTRRSALKGLAGAGVIGATAAMAPIAAAATAPQVGQIAFVRVNTTTAWLSASSSRTVDNVVVASTPYPQLWVERMTYDQERDLVGRVDTQAAVNSRAKVQAISGTWAQVSFLDQPAPNAYGYQTAWVPLAHLTYDPEFQSIYSSAKRARVTAASTMLCSDAAMTRQLMRVPFNAELPYTDAYTWEQATVHLAGYGKAYARRQDLAMFAAPRGTAAAVIATAKTFLGVPYLWSGTTPFGFDCSGFTYSMLRRHSINVSRDAGPQRNSSGLPAVERTDLIAGDLVFWASEPGSTKIAHVGIYIGDGEIIHAAGVGGSVRIQSLSSVGDPTYAGAVRPTYA